MSVTTLADPMFKQFWKESEEHDDVRCLHEDGATLHSVVRHDRPTAELNEATPNGCLSQENEMNAFKELSDEEIMEIYDRDELYTIMDGQMYLKPVEFARALFKKASEKCGF
jgi:hypothetical protein